MPTLLLRESAIYEALRSFLLGVVTTPSMEIVRAQVNRVPMPRNQDYAIFTPLRSQRLATNQTIYSEIEFTGSIVDDLLTVEVLMFGAGLIPAMGVESVVATLASGTAIVAQLDGTIGGAGTYRVLPGSQAVAPGNAMFSSSRLDLVATQLTAQLDVYGPTSWENAQAIQTLFQSSYGFSELQALNIDVAPLYCEDARQVAFTDGERQWEDRWMMELALQVNPTVLTLQQAATAVEIALDVVDLD